MAELGAPAEEVRGRDPAFARLQVGRDPRPVFAFQSGQHLELRAQVERGGGDGHGGQPDEPLVHHRVQGAIDEHAHTRGPRDVEHGLLAVRTVAPFQHRAGLEEVQRKLQDAEVMVRASRLTCRLEHAGERRRLWIARGRAAVFEDTP